MLKLNPWDAVSRALWDALDFPDDAVRLNAADQVLRAALKAAGWLDESPVP